MRTLWITFYNWLVVPVFWIGLHLGGLFNSKIRRGLQGRQGLFERLEQDARTIPAGKRIWVHSSSMGEFEQSKPIIAALKKRHPDARIIATFFSPSGYDHSRNYKLADLITYIPFDSRENARRFIELLKPDAAVMVRYDVWPNHIWELRRRGIPVFLANATMRGNSARLRWPWKEFHRHLYENLTSILTVSTHDAAQFARFGITTTPIIPVGETRYDQVLQRSADAKQRHLLPDKIIRRRRVVVAGSTWPEDEDVLLPALRKLLQHDPQLLFIVVPHEPTEQALESIERRLEPEVKSVRFSGVNDYKEESVILVDSVGILMSLYQYAHVAYVGGSFKQNVHNVLEPAVYGIPVVYGPRHTNSQEAVELARRQAGFVVNDQQEAYRVLRSLLRESTERETAGGRAEALVKEHAGATERFLGYLEPRLWTPVEEKKQKQEQKQKREQGKRQGKKRGNARRIL